MLTQLSILPVKETSSNDTRAIIGIPSTSLERSVGLLKSDVLLTVQQSSFSSLFSAAIIETHANQYNAYGKFYNSNPIHLKWNIRSSLLMNNSVELFYYFPNNEFISNFDVNYPVISFSTICNGFGNKIENYRCLDSGKDLTHTCRNQAGENRSYCPKLIPTCQSINITTSKSTKYSDCYIFKFNTSFTICRCVIKGIVDNSAFLTYRRLDVSGQLFQSSGVNNIASISEYESFQFLTVFYQAPALNSTQDISTAYIVISVFAGLWSFGILVILWRYLF
jgi:hypothetical protein